MVRPMLRQNALLSAAYYYVCMFYSQYGCTPVFYASKKGHTAIVELLVEKGGDVSMSNKVRIPEGD